MPDTFQVKLQLSKDDFTKEKEELGDPTVHAIETVDPRDLDSATTEAMFIEPVTAIITVSAALLAERIVRHWIRSRENGVQIDMRQTPPIVSAIAGTPFGFVMAIKPDGEAVALKIDYGDVGNIAAAIENVTKIFGSGS